MVLIHISMKNGVSGSHRLHWVRAACLPRLGTSLAVVFTTQLLGWVLYQLYVSVVTPAWLLPG